MTLDINTLTQLIGSVGFPVVMCIYMMVVNNKAVSANTEATNALREVVAENARSTERLVELANILIERFRKE